MIKDTSTRSICFDDILLVPKQSSISSRGDINVETKLGNPNNPSAILNLYTPLMMAPMEYISSTDMLKSVKQVGGFGFIQRFQTTEKRFSQAKDLGANSGFAISIDECYDKDFIEKVLSYGIKIILIDTSFAHTDVCINAVKHLRDIVPNEIHIMSGNVSSADAYNALMDAGADSVRVGIGGGSACTTRIVTGFGVPTLSSIMDVYDSIDKNSVNGIVADGGIKQNGDIVKSLAGGASAVMMGSFFAGHDECDGEIVEGKAIFRGLASREIQIDSGESKDKVLHVEGVQGFVKAKGSVKKTFSEAINNIKSGISYTGQNNITGFQKNVKYIDVSYQSIVESGSRI
jgi:IMP dehydrogenase